MGSRSTCPSERLCLFASCHMRAAGRPAVRTEESGICSEACLMAFVLGVKICVAERGCALMKLHECWCEAVRTWHAHLALAGARYAHEGISRTGRCAPQLLSSLKCKQQESVAISGQASTQAGRVVVQ